MGPERWQQVERIFEAALDCDPAKRAAFLDQECGDDDVLRGEVEALIMADEIAAQKKTTGFQDLIQAGMSGDDDSLIGQTLSHYQIESLLGEGGMGKVYLAFDNNLKRRVAIKILPSHYTIDPDRVRRFEREAQAASSLNHPNIITIHEIGKADEAHYIVTELIDGQTLRRRMEQGRMSLSEVLEIAVQVAGALVKAHEAAIIHRDIKPENVMVRSDGLVKVLDFGLAKLTESHTDRSVTEKMALDRYSTEMGKVMGTARYMSPEQAQGMKVDARTDIFSFGSLLYEMATGRKAFSGENAMSTMAAVISQEPEWAAVIPQELGRIVHRCMRKDPEQRFQHMSDVKVELAEILQELAAAATPKVNKGRRSFIAMAVVIAAMIIAYTIWSRREDRPERPLLAVPLTSY